MFVKICFPGCVLTQQLTRSTRSTRLARLTCLSRLSIAGQQASAFTHMGLSIRTNLYRYSEWFRWDGTVCAPHWSLPSDGVELYSHVGDNVPGCFDCTRPFGLRYFAV